MTGKHDKLRSLFLTALMVMSVFAMTVTFAGGAAANHESGDSDADVHLESGERFWGQTVWFNANSSETYELWSVDDGEAGEFITSIRTNDQGNASYDTLGLDSGQYVIRTQGGNNVSFATDDGEAQDHDATIGAAAFSVTTQSLSAEFADASVEDDETTDIEITSNRGLFNVTVSADGDLSTSDLEDIFNGDNLDTEETDDDDEIELIDVSEGDYTANFTDISTGEYDFDFEVSDTGASSSASINVSDAGEGDAEFSQGVVQEHIGDVATIPVQLENTDSATVVIGSNDNGYHIAANVTADDEGEEVELLFNTYKAGNSPADEVLYLDDDSDNTIENVWNQSDNSSADLLDTGNYNMNVTSGDVGTDYHNADDQGTLSLQDRSTEELTVWTMPDGEIDGDSDAADVWSAVGSSVTEADAITEEDDVLIAIEGTGLQGAIETHGINVSEAGNLSLNVTHENPGMNAEAQDLDLSGSVEGVNDADNDTYFVVLDTDSIGVGDGSAGEYEEGREYEANFTIDSSVNNALADDDEYVSSGYEFEEADASLDTETRDGEDLVVVQPEEDQTITGDTNIAPGSEVTVHISSDDDESPFLITPETTVEEDGTFNASTDEFADVGMGANFTAVVREDGSDLSSDEFDGRVMEAQEEDNETTPTPTETEEPTPTETEEPTPTETEEPEGTPTDDGGDETPTEEEGPGFGVAVGLIALIGAALLAARRQN